MARRIRRRFSLVEQLAAIAADALLDREERGGVAGTAQRADVGLSEILVLAFERVRKRRVLDQTLTASLRQVHGWIAFCIAAAVDRGERHVVEALRPPGAGVEDARQLGVVEKVQVDLDDVLDRDEVAALLAVPVPPRPDKGTHAPLRRILVEKMPGHRRHADLVPFVHAVHVEVAEPGDLRARFAQAPPDGLIEQEFRVAVDVERRLGLPFLAKLRDRKSTRLNSSHTVISYAVFCLKKKTKKSMS